MSKRLRRFSLKRRQIIILTLSGGMILFVFFVLMFSSRVSLQNKAVAQQNVQVQSSEVISRHPLTGFPLEVPIATPRVYGVMIDNHEDAWPQAGLDQAFFVYEAPVEAGISRMLAFFSEEQSVEKIGPVRSARPYFLDWNNELDALYAHVGGSAAALDLIASGGTFDLNEYWFGNYFWRSLGRYAPHNTYTSTALMGTYMAEKIAQGFIADPLYESWSFKDSDPAETTEVERVNISFYPPTYVVRWDYDAVLNRYKRYQAGSVHVMEDGSEIWSDTVAVVVTDISILDGVGRRRIETIGEGSGFVFRDGLMIEGIWKKESKSQRLRFFDEAGKEIAMNAGITWIEVVGHEQAVSF